MKYKKGFTLVEIIAVIVILSIIAIIVVPSILDSRVEVKNKLYLTKMETSKQAATLWAQDNKKCLKEVTKVDGTLSDECKILENCESNGDTVSCDVKLGNLAVASYLKYDDGKKIIDPRNGNSMNDEYVGVIYNAKSKTIEINLDTSGPIISLKDVPSNYVKNAPTITVTLTDNSGIKGYIVSDTVPIDNKKPEDLEYKNLSEEEKNKTQISFKYGVTSVIDGEQVFYVYTEDKLGNTSVKSFKVKGDVAGPVIENIVTDPIQSVFARSKVTIKAKVSDKGIGASHFCISETTRCSSYSLITESTIKGDIGKNGNYYIIAKDKLDNETVSEVISVNNIDNVGPTINLTTTPSSSTYYSGSFVVKGNITDASGVEGYTINTTSANPTSLDFDKSTISYSVNSTGTYYIHAMDNAGNYNTKSFYIRFDNSSPIIKVTSSSASEYLESRYLNFSISDSGGSGLASNSTYALTTSLSIPAYYNFTSFSSGTSKKITASSTSPTKYYVWTTMVNDYAGNTSVGYGSNLYSNNYSGYHVFGPFYVKKMEQTTPPVVNPPEPETPVTTTPINAYRIVDGSCDVLYITSKNSSGTCYYSSKNSQSSSGTVSCANLKTTASAAACEKTTRGTTYVFSKSGYVVSSTGVISPSGGQTYLLGTTYASKKIMISSRTSGNYRFIYVPSDVINTRSVVAGTTLSNQPSFYFNGTTYYGIWIIMSDGRTGATYV